MKKILMVGGTRYIGRALVQQHIKDGDQVTIVTRGMTEDPFGNNVVRVHLDLMDVKDVESKFPRDGYDFVYDTMVLCPDHIEQRLTKVDCDKYIMVSTAGVYRNKHLDISELEFDASKEAWTYCGYHGIAYDERKRQAEAALVQGFSDIRNVRVRIPVVIGQNDYTQRLKWYVDHICEEKPMKIENIDVKLPFAYVKDVSTMMYQCAKSDFEGAINGALDGTISVRELINYIEDATGKRAIIYDDGELAPYTDCVSYSLNTEVAKQIGCEINNINTIKNIVDYYVMKQMEKGILTWSRKKYQ